MNKPRAIVKQLVKEFDAVQNELPMRERLIKEKIEEIRDATAQLVEMQRELYELRLYGETLGGILYE